jgi:hypothetical protein
MTALGEIKSFFWRTKEKPKAEEPKPTPEAAKKETPPEKKPQGNWCADWYPWLRKLQAKITTFQRHGLRLHSGSASNKLDLCDSHSLFFVNRLNQGVTTLFRHCRECYI